jgi:hypothetical protein
MSTRELLSVGAATWAVVGGCIAASGLRQVNADARYLVAIACVVGPVSAILAGLALRGHHDRGAGWFFLVSVVTPTFAAAALNIPALVGGALLVVAPRAVFPPQRMRPAERARSGAGVLPERTDDPRF